VTASFKELESDNVFLLLLLLLLLLWDLVGSFQKWKDVQI